MANSDSVNYPKHFYVPVSQISFGFCVFFLNQVTEWLPFLRTCQSGFHFPLSSVTGILQWAALSSLPQRDVRTPSVVAERCGLASTSPSGPPFGKWCSTSMVIFKLTVHRLHEVPLFQSVSSLCAGFLRSFGHSILQSPACNRVHVWGLGFQKHWRTTEAPNRLSTSEIYKGNQR